MLDLLDQHLAQRPDRVAFQFADRALDYRQLERLSRRYAAALVGRCGLAPGDRVAVLAGSRWELVVALLGHLRAGVVHVPVNNAYGAAEIGHILADSGASALLVEHGTRAAVVAAELAPDRRQLVIGAPAGDSGERFEALLDRPAATLPARPADDDLAMLIYTSGTTGPAKGVMLSYRALAANLGATARGWGFCAADRLVLALPLFHVHGLGLGVLGTLLHGMTAEVHPRFEARRVLAALADGGGTVFMGVPTMYTRLLAALDAEPALGPRLAGVRLFTSGSAALPAADFERFRRHTGHDILERYGMSETLFTLSNPYVGDRRAGTVGFPVAGCAVQVVDEAGAPVAPGALGEITVRSNGIMSGYWGRPEETARSFDGAWFLTGDVGTVDTAGYHRIVGRRSVDLIKSGGFKISAREIEDALRTCPGVEDAAVVGVPDPEWGELIAAAVVLAADPPRALAAGLEHALGAHVARSLAAYKKPRRVLALDALPRNALGKVQKHRLKELFEPA